MLSSCMTRWGVCVHMMLMKSKVYCLISEISVELLQVTEVLLRGLHVKPRDHLSHFRDLVLRLLNFRLRIFFFNIINNFLNGASLIVFLFFIRLLFLSCTCFLDLLVHLPLLLVFLAAGLLLFLQLVSVDSLQLGWRLVLFVTIILSNSFVTFLLLFLR